MPPLPVTAAFTALAAVVLVALSLAVSLRRIKARVPLGDGGDPDLRLRIRAQGNFVEQVPIALIALGLVEAASPTWVALTLGGMLAAGRLLNALGMFRDAIPLRAAGMVLTYSMLLLAAGRLAIVSLG